jgi:hypothetical protein
VHLQRTNAIKATRMQGGQMAYFQTKNPNLGKFWRDLQWNILAFLWPFGIFYGHLVYFVAVGYILFLLFAIVFPFWYVAPRKIWQPCTHGRRHGREKCTSQNLR